MRARALRCIGIVRRLAARCNISHMCTCTPVAAFSAACYLILCGSLPFSAAHVTALSGYRSERAYPAHFAIYRLEA